MDLKQLLPVVLSIAAVAASASASPQLDDGRQWLERNVPLTKDSPALLRAAAAAALNDVATAEPLLRSVIRAQPESDAASQAYELLSRNYLRTGQYERLLRNFDAWAQALPGRAAVLEEQADIEMFRGLPDQRNGRRRPSHLVHEAGHDFSIPLSIGGKPATYLVDTGAWVNVMTSAEAARLGLTPATTKGTLGDASGTGVQVSTAIAKELTIGSMRFRDVSFSVFPSDDSGGIIGMPILLALGRVRWSSAAGWEVGASAESPASGRPNLVFYENKLLLSADVLGQRVFGTLDTGAGTTDLNANFAEQFADIMRLGSEKHQSEITGLGGTASFETVVVPEVRFVIAGADVALRPVPVTFQTLPSMGGECCIGNFGRDLLIQSGSLTLDFSSMTLRFD